MESMSFRCDQQIKSELLFIQNQQESTQSQAIKAAIHAYYLFLQEEERSKKSPVKIFKKSGYLGSFKGDRNLSTNYKEIISKGMKLKYGEKQ